MNERFNAKRAIHDALEIVAVYAPMTERPNSLLTGGANRASQDVPSPVRPAVGVIAATLRSRREQGAWLERGPVFHWVRVPYRGEVG